MESAIQESFRPKIEARIRELEEAMESTKQDREAIAPDKFRIDAAPEVLGLYQFGAATAKHYFCKQCGIYTFHVTARVPDHYRANLGCVEGIDTFALTADVFDGKHLL